MSKYKQVKVNFTILDHYKIATLAKSENKTIVNQGHMLERRLLFKIYEKVSQL